MNNIYGQTAQDSLQADRQKMFDWFAYPFIFYTPEVNFAFGAGGIVYFRTARFAGARPSKITASAYYSIENQYLVYLSPSVYFNQNISELAAEISFDNGIDEFYGIGNDSPEINEPAYRFNKFFINARYRHELVGGLKITAVYEFMQYLIVDTKNNPILNTQEVYGSDGGINSGFGLGITFDTRDNVFFPVRGYFMEVDGVYFSDTFGSDYKFNRYTFDLRYYLSLTPNDNVFALQGYASSTGGDPPFYSLPRLGGQNRMRGYYEGRYRDKNYLMAQVEFRKELFWRISGTVFIGVGDVGENMSDFRFKNLKYSVGGGIRYTLDKEEKINIRADIGFGKNTMGFYFGIEEAF